MIYHSDEKKMRENFLNYLKGWDLSIESLDDKEEQLKIEAILIEAVNFLNMQIAEWDEATMNSENGAEKLVKLQENPKYRNFRRISDNLYGVRSLIGRLFEIKNRRTKEIIELKGEIARLKVK